jgi:ABC-2 type transport system permease protein
MFWYKAWRESRSRFLISAFVVIALCTVIVLFEDTLRAALRAKAGPPVAYVAYIYRLIYSGPVRGLFTIFALILGLGGLHREVAQKSIGFTLSLPVSRLKLVVVRAGIGLLQIVVLALLPVLLIQNLSPLVHESYPLSQTLQFSLLWMVGGAVVFSGAFLVSTVVRNEYSALTVAFIIFFFHSLLVAASPLRRYPLHLHHIMSGYEMPYFDASKSLLVGALPWAILMVITTITFSWIILVACITQRQEFS